MKILFCGGGTAGHIMPAISMAEIMLRKKENTEVAFIGRSGGDENLSIIKGGYKLYTLDIMGLQRSLSLKNIKAVIKILKSSRMSKKIISEFKPDLIIGTGGYVCYPIIQTATRMRIPTIIHESNVYPGLVTRTLSKKCTLLLLNSEGTKKYLSHKCKTMVIGNPIRSDFSSIKREDARKKLGIGNTDFFILSFGGSLGSETMNKILIEVMSKYSKSKTDIIHIHATGNHRYEEIKKQNPRLCIGVNGCRILPYIDSMPLYLKAADLVICRSGAMTLSELATTGTASILIPSPNVADNHQYKNAKYVSESGGAAMIEEKDLNFITLTSCIESIKQNSKKRKEIGEKIRLFARADTEKLLLKAINDIM